MRIDKYLTIKNLCESRNKASALIAMGAVKVDGIVINKASFDVKDGSTVVIDNQEKQYVSRSAKKLITAIERFNLELNSKIAVDLGASTGGFCQVMIEHGIKHIYAVDVGTNQLHKSLRDNSVITNVENTNARYITSDTFPEQIDIITCDLSFISLKLVLTSVFCVLKDQGEFICLVKPQFEAGKKHINKNGVVKDVTVQASVVKEIVSMAAQVGFDVMGTCFSGIEGETGNREYLLYMIKRNERLGITPEQAKMIVIEENK